MHPSFGRYELLKRLAGGGMGEVYLARQRGLAGFQKLLVIKTLLAHLCEDEEFITMFKDEARLSAQLIHPNICQVYEFDQAGGSYYIAMEYLRGEDLRKLWRACEQKGNPLRVPLICRIAADAAAGLDFAHSLRDAHGHPCHIVHRDISPQNILVTFEGGVKIIDFGVAKAAGRAQHTRTGALKGKYGYMSPEQVAGAAIDGRTDIFALGIVLHELLTGRRLFKCDSEVETLARVRECKVPPPSELNPRLPRGLDGIVLKALAKEPRDRFATAQELRLALEEWLIQGRMSASSAHLAEFLKVIYAERLEQEARFGPLLGDPGLSDAPAQLRQATPTPSAGLDLPRADATLEQRTPTAPTPARSEIDESMIKTESASSPFKRRRARLGAALAAAAAGIALVGSFVLRTPAKPERVDPALLTVHSDPEGAAVTVDGKPAGRTPLLGYSRQPGVARIELALDGFAPQAHAEQLAAGAQERRYQLEKTAPQKFTVVLKTDPAGAEITEGAVVVGTSPHIWSATPGEHRLSFSLAGYRELTQAIQASADGQEVLVRLSKLAPERRRAARDPAIKAER